MTRTEATDRGLRGRRWVVIALLIAVVVVVGAALFASGAPDGLERVAEDTGFIGAAEGSPFSIIADYAFPGVDGPLATILAGLVGVAVLFGTLWLLGRTLSRRRA